MNERIKEPYYSLMYKASEGWNDHLFQVPPELLEKFAEMIVRECISTCIKQPANWEAEYATAYNSGIGSCISGIKKHFGVEE